MDLTKEIGKKLAKIVPNITIYRENIPQNFNVPAFYIYEVHASTKDELMKSETRKQLYCVVYFPDEKDEKGTKEQCEIMREKLMNELLFLDDVKLSIYNREATIDHDVMNFSFYLRYRMVFEEEMEKVNDLTIEGDVNRD